MDQAQTILATIKLVQDLAPAAVALVKSLAEKLTGKTEAEIGAIAHQLNLQAEAEIDAELKSPAK